MGVFLASDKPTSKELERALMEPDELIQFGDKVVHKLVENWMLLAAALILALLGGGIYQVWHSHHEGKEDKAAAALYDAEQKLPDADPMAMLQKLQGGDSSPPADDTPELKEAAEAFAKVASEHGGTRQADMARVQGGATWFRLGEYAKAAEMFGVARRSKVELVSLLGAQGEGQALIALKEYERAASAFDFLREKARGPIQEQAWLDLARAKENQGKKEEAIALYEEFQKRFIDSSLLVTARSRMSSLQGGSAPATPPPAAPVPAEGGSAAAAPPPTAPPLAAPPASP